MSCLICNELLHHHIITCGLISCVSHINTISPPKLSPNYQNQTRTFQRGKSEKGCGVCGSCAGATKEGEARGRERGSGGGASARLAVAEKGEKGGGSLEGKELTSGPHLPARVRERGEGRKLAGWAAAQEEKSAGEELGRKAERERGGKQKEFHFFSKTNFQTHFSNEN